MKNQQPRNKKAGCAAAVSLPKWTERGTSAEAKSAQWQCDTFTKHKPPWSSKKILLKQTDSNQSKVTLLL